MKRVAVFCGSSSGSNGVYREYAVKLGRALAGKSIELVFGGGKVGLMGVLADSALEAGGSVVGVIPAFLNIKEVAHKEVSELITVSSMHERKALIYDISDGFIALPGGFGTLDELFETLTWGQLGLHSKPVGLLNMNRFFDPLLLTIQKMVGEGFLRTDHQEQLLVADQIHPLLDAMSAYKPPSVAKWIGLE